MRSSLIRYRASGRPLWLRSDHFPTSPSSLVTPSMITENLPEKYRLADYFSHIDMGFLNRRLAMSALGPVRDDFLQRQRPGNDHLTQLGNDHLLVTMLIDVFDHMKAPPLAEALKLGKERHVFMSTERLDPCPEIYNSIRVSHNVHLEFNYDKPVVIDYHTSHVVSDTGRMTLADGYDGGHRQAILGLLHNRSDRFQIEPIVIGAPWLDHPRNQGGQEAVWLGRDYGEVLPEDIEEFAAMNSIRVESADEWMNVMRNVPEADVKAAITRLLKEPSKADWGGEENDHFSASLTVAGQRRTAAFLLKGPTNFREMTPAMCGANGDQIYRLNHGKADISVVQHSHLIGPAVRETVRAFVVQPGRSRKFCIMDGQATYRLLKAYDLFPNRD
jgi:hypothetical protein